MSEAAEGCVTVKYSLAGHPNHNQLKFSLKPTEDTGYGFILFFQTALSWVPSFKMSD